jgi:hypothetical protein
MTTLPTDITSEHEDNAQAIRQDLQRLASGIRGFSLLTTERRRRVVISGHVDDDYLRSMALLLEAQPELATVCQITAAEVRDHLSFSGAYHGVGEELILNGRKMDDTLISERASIGERLLRTQKIARNINTPAGNTSLVPHLEALDRDFSRGRRKRPRVKSDESNPPKLEVTP